MFEGLSLKNKCLLDLSISPKGICCFKGKKNSDLNAIPPLCRLLWDLIIFTMQN